jgi:hypothetical protein
MYKFTSYLLGLLFSSACIASWAQDSVTVDDFSDEYQSIVKPNPKDIYDTHYMLDNHVWQYADSGLTNFHRYNPIEKQDIPMLIISNLGQAYTPITFQSDENVGYRHGFDAFERYLFTTSSQRYFKTLTPFTSIYYMVGGKAEQTVEAIHAQNIKKNASIAFNIRRFFSDGKIPNNRSQVQNVSLNNFTATKNKKYELLAVYIFNKVNNEEYGGSAVANVYDDKVYSSRKDALPTLLSGAANAQKSHTLQLKHYVHLNTLTSIYLQTYYQKFEHNYSDHENSSTYYSSFYIDSNNTEDIFRSHQVSQQLGIGSHPQNPMDSIVDVSRKWWQISVTGDYIHNTNFTLLDKIGDVYLSAIYGTNPYYKGYIKHLLEGKVHLSPPYFGDIYINEKLQWAPIEMLTVVQDISWKSQSPTWLQNQYMSNHFVWDNDFKKVISLHSSTEIGMPKWHTSFRISYDWSRNYMYYDSLAIPRQYAGGLHVLTCMAKQAFDFRNFFIQGIFNVQYSSNTDVLPMPVAFVNAQFYYKGKYFKNKINAQLGAEIFYYTPYKALGYMPATTRFYVQGNELIKPQPRLDLFFNLSIKKAKVFFKYQYVNEGLPKRGFYVAPNFLSQDRGFKVGARWDFHD